MQEERMSDGREGTTSRGLNRITRDDHTTSKRAPVWALIKIAMHSEIAISTKRYVVT